MSKLHFENTAKAHRNDRNRLAEAQRDTRMLDMRTRQRLTPEEVSRMADDLLRRHRAK